MGWAMEINPEHSITSLLRKMIAEGNLDGAAKDVVWLLFDIALLSSGAYPADPGQLAGRIHREMERQIAKRSLDNGMGELKGQVEP